MAKREGVWKGRVGGFHAHGVRSLGWEGLHYYGEGLALAHILLVHQMHAPPLSHQSLSGASRKTLGASPRFSPPYRPSSMASTATTTAS